MGLKQTLTRLIGRQVFGRPAQKRTYAEHAADLRKDGEQTRERLAAATARTPKHHDTLRHLIGIERWGQRRLRTLLGEPLEMDGHHPYKPPADADWTALSTDFGTTRADTMRLADELARANPAGTVPHNAFGPLNARGWLRYLRMHAKMESKRLK